MSLTGVARRKRFRIKEAFGYDLGRTCDEIRPGYRHVESCQATVPEAITPFWRERTLKT